MQKSKTIKYSYACTLHITGLKNLHAKIRSCLLRYAYANIYIKNVLKVVAGPNSVHSLNFVPRSGSKMNCPVPNRGNQCPVFQHDHIKYHQFFCLYFHLFITFKQYLKALLTSRSLSFHLNLLITNTWHI